jgi:hypothetical protein
MVFVGNHSEPIDYNDQKSLILNNREGSVNINIQQG